MRGIVSKELVYNLVLNKGMSIQSNCIDIDNEFIIKLKRNVTTLYVYTSVLIQYYRNQQTKTASVTEHKSLLYMNYSNQQKASVTEHKI